MAKKEGKDKKKKIFSFGLSGNGRTIGQRSADALTKWAGSWPFIIFLLVFIAAWIFLNVKAYMGQWDPWPFIILNLCLSCIAALQAPVILMSQNRQAHRDRQRTEYDYAVDRKSEKGIRELKKQLNRIEKHMMMKRKK